MYIQLVNSWSADDSDSCQWYFAELNLQICQQQQQDQQKQQQDQQQHQEVEIGAIGKLLREVTLLPHLQMFLCCHQQLLF